MAEIALFPVTYACNLECKYCHSRSNRNIDAVASVRALKTSGAQWVYITGGEPLLVENIFDICDDLRTAGLRVGLTTNGTIDRPEIAAHVDRLGVSIDGGPGMMAVLRGAGVYEQAVGFAKAVAGKTETVIMTTLCPDTREQQIKEVRNVQNIIGFDHIQFSEVQ
jgi:MoaA/NifB/PqqE/SkfB family radical SAM enzyme